MKEILISAVLAVLTFSGCATMERLDSVRSTGEKLMGPDPGSAAMATMETVPGMLTPEEARDIALKAAGLTLGQISRLQVEYDPEDGQPRYEVEFHQGPWEYHYEIDARTGEVLEQERDH